MISTKVSQTFPEFPVIFPSSEMREPSIGVNFFRVTSFNESIHLFLP